MQQLTPGTRLGSYEVGVQLGAGGMGEVYQATDTQLSRQVAIKVLPAAVAADADRLARFDREARTLAALNHPNIAHIYGVEKSPSTGSGQAGTTALVMELVEGPTLAERIAQGALPLAEALPIARQIAEALEAAHAQGIIHRDLKPANVKVRSDGTVKVLDFGLAKALESGSGIGDQGSVGGSMSPTLTTPAMTQAGVILGTAAYMAPEQARGKSVDMRADIWAFGAVIFEMLAGTRAFDGEDATEVLGAVVRLDPDLDALPSTVPARVRQVIRACLQKNVKQRLAHMQDVRLALDGVFDTPGQPASTASPAAATRSPWRRALPLVATALVVAAIAGSAAWTLRSGEPRMVTRLAYTLPEGRSFINPIRQILAMDPTGRRLVYLSSAGLILRSLDSLEEQALVGPDRAAVTFSPFFSPDGESVGYFDSADRGMRRVAVSGGTPLTLARLGALVQTGASWEPDGTILYSQTEGIWQVSENGGGEPHSVLAAKAGQAMFAPRRLPGGDWILYTVSRDASSGESGLEIVVESPSKGERRVLRRGAADARYVPTGHLVFAQGGVLYAAPFDASELSMGAPVPVVQSVQRSASGDAFYGVSSNGTLVYARGASDGTTFTLTWVDSAGRRQPIELPPGQYQYPRLSPDGRWLAFERLDGGLTNIWLYETSGSTAERRLTEGGNNRYPVWSRDGAYLVFQSDREGDRGIFRQRADGTGSIERLTMPAKDVAHVPEDWSPAEDRLVFSSLSQGGVELWTWTLADREAVRVGTLQSTSLFDTEFSPDGKWIAYTERTNAGTGSYVQQVTAANRYQVGGNAELVHHPIWSHDQKRLIYFPGGAAAVSVTVKTEPTVVFGRPEPLPGMGLPLNVEVASLVNHDVGPDGRFVTLVPGDATGQERQEIVVVQNWFDELRRLVPVK